jgi:hypothetical protein
MTCILLGPPGPGTAPKACQVMFLSQLDEKCTFMVLNLHGIINREVRLFEFFQAVNLFLQENYFQAILRKISCFFNKFQVEKRRYKNVKLRVYFVKLKYFNELRNRAGRFSGDFSVSNSI